MSATANDTSPAPISSRAALRNAGMGEIVQVQGGHIVRSTGRKDRHSKVCTAKGPRDRRVRLSAHTAIQFYDVQDRLGYDRPSKAVDWLIKKAKNAIDQLEELPAWKPTTTTVLNVRGKKVADVAKGENEDVAMGESSKPAPPLALTEDMYGSNDGTGGGLLPPSMDSDSIADTIKSFFPGGGGGGASVAMSSAGGLHSMQFQTYQPPSQHTNNNGQMTQDLKLSLQSFQDPVGFQTHHHRHHQHQQTQQHQQSLFEFSNPSAGWAGETTQQEMGRYQRQLIGWNLGNIVDSDCTRGAGAGFVFVPPQQPQPQPLLQQLFGHGIGGVHGIGPNNNSSVDNAATTSTHSYSQRGPLQSSNTPSIRAWMGDNYLDAAPTTAKTSGGCSHHKDDHRPAAPSPFVHPVSGYTSSGGFSGFHIPARIQGGDEEQHGGNMSSSASPGSHH